MNPSTSTQWPASGDMMPNPRLCRNCNVEFSTENRESYCSDSCRVEGKRRISRGASGRWRDRHPEKRREAQRAALLRAYGLTSEQFEALLAAQGGGCAICGGQDSGDGRRFHVDHDHACCGPNRSCARCRRGLLCLRCNHLLGNALDDPERLMRAARYLFNRGGLE